MDLAGMNICVLDLETARSAEDCRHCGKPQAAHVLGGPGCDRFAPIGWNDHTVLGLSIGCYFDYRDGLYHFFDGQTLAATMGALASREALLVTFNGKSFDLPLMLSVLAPTLALDGEYTYKREKWQRLADASYDILDVIWQVVPERKYERGLNSLGAISEANGLGSKAMDGATAPRLWAAGHYAEVIEYCRADVTKTKQLFELIIDTGSMLRGDGQPMTLPRPVLPGCDPWPA